MASEQLASALDLINQKIVKAYETIKGLKGAANALAASENEPVVYADVVDEMGSAAGTRSIRADQFTAYPSPSTAARAYLEMRGKQVGATSIEEIFDALKRGGYAFDGPDVEAKKGLSIALGKDAQVKRLSNGTYGLVIWYGDRFTSKKDKAPAEPTPAPQAPEEPNPYAAKSKVTKDADV